MKYDVFISHANSDKEEYVNDLKSSIDQLGVNVFYDKDTLQWGDNWKQKMLEGIKNAEFAIIVISKSFFGREWTEKELNDFLERQNSNGQKIILPILHNISFDELKEHYPSIADIQAIESNKYSCDKIALFFAKQLIQRIRTNNSDDGKRIESDDQTYISRLKQAYDSLMEFRRSIQINDDQKIDMKKLTESVQKIYEYYEYYNTFSDSNNDARICKAKEIVDQFNVCLNKLHILKNSPSSVTPLELTHLNDDLQNLLTIIIQALHEEGVTL
ncbi:toll/interleukin-1 receptor domain-containing protein [bacterium]|nr:toll/interleukin-1 receptor domain-containing protein [bacterium]